MPSSEPGKITQFCPIQEDHLRLLSVLLLGCVSLLAAGPQRKADVAADDRIIPHLAFGGSWSTTITLVNVYHSAAAVDLRFYDSNGVPMPVPTDIQGNTSVVRVNLPIGGSQRINIAGGGDTRVGWARLDYDWAISEVAATAVFRQSVPGRADFEALVPADNETSQFRVQFDEVNGYTTGLALANTSATQVVLEVTARNEAGQPINQAPVELTLPSFGHTAFALTAHPQLGPIVRNRRGVIDIKSISGSSYSALGLRFSSAGSFTTVVPFYYTGD